MSITKERGVYAPSDDDPIKMFFKGTDVTLFINDGGERDDFCDFNDLINESLCDEEFFGSDHSDFVFIKSDQLTDNMIEHYVSEQEDGSYVIRLKYDNDHDILLCSGYFEELYETLEKTLITGSVVSDITVDDLIDEDFVNDELDEDDEIQTYSNVFTTYNSMRDFIIGMYETLGLEVPDKLPSVE